MSARKLTLVNAWHDRCREGCGMISAFITLPVDECGNVISIDDHALKQLARLPGGPYFQTAGDEL